MDKKEKIQELMNAKKPVTLGLIAKELGCTDLEAAQALPDEVCSFIKDIASFDELWAQMSQWEKVTLFNRGKKYSHPFLCKRHKVAVAVYVVDFAAVFLYERGNVFVKKAYALRNVGREGKFSFLSA